jgi:hypothetical protein
MHGPDPPFEERKAQLPFCQSQSKEMPKSIHASDMSGDKMPVQPKLFAAFPALTAGFL